MPFAARPSSGELPQFLPAARALANDGDSPRSRLATLEELGLGDTEGERQATALVGRGQSPAANDATELVLGEPDFATIWY